MEGEWLSEVFPEAIKQAIRIKEMQDEQSKEQTTGFELDLSNIAKIPIVMIAGTKDSICSIKDTNTLLLQTQKNNKEVTLTHIKGASHQDLVGGKDLSHFKNLLIPSLLKHIRIREQMTEQPDQATIQNSVETSWFEKTINYLF